MFAFKISINGNTPRVCGFEDWNILHAIINAKRADGGYIDRDQYDISVGGLALRNATDTNEHVRFGEIELSLGDEISIMLIDTENVEQPKKRYRSDAQVQENPFTDEEIHAFEKADYERLKAKFEGQN